MRHDIRFGGYSGPSKPAVRSWPPHGPDAVEVLFGDFCNFLGKRWLRAENGAIQHAVATAARMELAVEAYCAHRQSDPVIDVSEGLDVEEALVVSQAVAGSSFDCLLNGKMAWGKIAPHDQMRLLTPENLVLAIRRRCKAIFDTDRNVVSQIREQGAGAEGMEALLLDGSVGHAVLIRGVERGSDRLLCWDPVGVRSCLGKGRNQAGVAARLVKSGEFFWTIPADELLSILFCVFERREVPNE